MDPVGDHDIADLAGKPVRRSRAWAWGVFWLTAGSSVLYNCYHALVDDRMPWYTGVPAGFVPLVVAIGVLEFSGGWRENKKMQAAAWLVTSGAMAWSAIATNSVVRNGWALGAICDTAALSAMYFLLNGPTAASAVARVAETIANLTERANAALRAKTETEANAARETSELRVAHAAELDRERRANANANADLAGQLAEANAALRGESERRRRADEELAASRAELAGVSAGLGTAEAGRRAADTAREDQAAQAERLVESLRARLDQAQAAAARVLAVEAERDTARRERDTLQAELSDANAARERAERSVAKAERAARKPAGSASAKAAPKTAVRDPGEQPAKTPAEIREDAHRRLDEDPDIPAKDLAEEFGMSTRWAEMRKADHERRNGLRAVGE